MLPAQWRGERSLMVILNPLIGPLGLYDFEACFRIADEEHIFIDSDQELRLHRSSTSFLRSSLVLIERTSLKGMVPALRSMAGSTICDFGMTKVLKFVLVNKS